MRIFVAALVIGPLMLTGALPAAAGPTMLAPGAGSPIRRVADVTPEAERQSYTRQVQDQMREWTRKLNRLGEQAEAKGSEAGKAAERDLNKAWAHAEAVSSRLQTQSGEGWQRAKDSYEDASRELQAAWDAHQPQGK